MRKFVLDIETRANADLIPIFVDNIKHPKNYKDQKKIDKWIKEKEDEFQKKMATDTDLCEIICIGIKELGKESKIFSLKEFSNFIKEIRINKEDWYFITFNGTLFDFPVIIKQGIKNKIDFPYQSLMNCCDKYKQSGFHLDLMTTLGEYGQYKSLDKYLQIYLNIKKKEIDFNTALDSEIIKHCIEDLENTEKIYNLFKPICFCGIKPQAY